MKSHSTLFLSPRAACALAILSFALSAPFAASAEVRSPVLLINEDAATADVSVLMGSGGNIGVYSGPGGKFLVDAGIAVSRPKITEALEKVGPAPVRYLVNTHYHWDHTDG